VIEYFLGIFVVLTAAEATHRRGSVGRHCDGACWRRYLKGGTILLALLPKPHLPLSRGWPQRGHDAARSGTAQGSTGPAGPVDRPRLAIAHTFTGGALVGGPVTDGGGSSGGGNGTASRSS
jgi:hypothetical protein